MNSSTLVSQGEIVTVTKQCTAVPPEYYLQQGIVIRILLQGLEVKFINGQSWYFSKGEVSKVNNIKKANHATKKTNQKMGS